MVDETSEVSGELSGALLVLRIHYYEAVKAGLLEIPPY
jgi:hypothetical protein